MFKPVMSIGGIILSKFIFIIPKSVVGEAKRKSALPAVFVIGEAA